jgi:hypothetical protein
MSFSEKNKSIDRAAGTRRGLEKAVEKMAPTVLYTPIVGIFPQIIPSFFPSTARHGSLHTHSNLHPAAALYVLFSRERNDDIQKHLIQQKLKI